MVIFFILTTWVLEMLELETNSQIYYIQQVLELVTIFRGYQYMMEVR